MTTNIYVQLLVVLVGFLTKTHHDLYLPDSPFGSKQIEMALELLSQEATERDVLERLAALR